MSVQPSIDSYFRRVPKRRPTKPPANNEQQKKQKRLNAAPLPSPPLTNPTRQRTPPPAPKSPKKGPDVFRTPSKIRFKSPIIPVCRLIEDDEAVPSSQTQLLQSPISPQVIPSSQTQFISPVRSLKFCSPHRPRPHPIQDDDDDIIPTSQSQERELLLFTPEPRDPPRQSPRAEDDKDIFNDNAPGGSKAPVVDDSETEPESEDDARPLPPISSSVKPSGSMRRWYTEGSSQPASVKSTPRRLRPLGQSSSVNDGDGVESIPDFIKEMNAIFEGTGSYPDDYPMSLRDL